jgi:transposase
MPKRTRIVIGGVDTHGRTHHAAVLDTQGRLLGDREFPADRGGYRQLLCWLGRHGQVGVVGVEGTGSYGAGLARYLLEQQVRVVEVDRPDRRIRRQRGRSDPIDAEAAARAVLAGVATAAPKRRDGIVEAIRVLRTAAGVPTKPAPRPSTSSRRYWSPRQPRSARRSTTSPRRC